MDENFSFGYWLRRQRLARDLRQDDLAARLGIATVTLRKIEADARRPSLQLIVRVAEVFGLDPAERETLRRVARADLSPAALPLPEESTDSSPDDPRAAADIAQQGAAANLRSSTIRRRLPRPLTPFIGRAGELGDLLARLRDPTVRMLTLVASGGMGKTRLALAAAQQLQHDSVFPDGITFAALAPVAEPASLDPTLAAALGLPLDAGGRRSPRTQLLDYLRTKQQLLILDNCEHLRDTVTELVRAILAEAPGVTLLATSRERLGLQVAQVLLLKGMEAATDGPLLFAATARMVQPALALDATTHRQMAAICARVGGMPLAIELAAGWADTLSLAEIAVELAKGDDLLVAQSADLEPRHRSVRAICDTTWARLSPPEQAIFAQVAVFRGGGTRRALQMVTGASLGQLHALVGKALLHYDPKRERYAVHELLRQYAAARLGEDAAAKHGAQERHALYYLGALAAQEAALKGAGQHQAIDEIGKDIENVQAAWGWAAAHSAFDLLAGAVGCLSLAYEWLGRSEDGLAAMRRGLAANDPAPGALQIRLLAAQARFTFLRGDRPAAFALLEQAQAICHAQAGAAAGAAHAEVLLQLGRCLAKQDFNAAQSAFSGSQALFEVGGDQWGAAMALSELGAMIVDLSPDYPRARSYLEQSVARFRSLGEQIALSEALVNLSLAARYMGHEAESLTLGREAYALAQASDNLHLIAQAASNLGAALTWNSAYEEAQAMLHTALAITIELGHKAELPNVYFRLGNATMLLGRYADARALLASGLAVAQQVNDAAEICAILNALSSTALAEGAYQEALHLAKQTTAHSERLGEVWMRLTSYGISALAARGLGDRARARADAMTALRFALSTRLLAEWGVWAVALLQMDSGELVRAATTIALADLFPPISNRWIDDIGLGKLRASLASLPPEVLAVAQARWAQHDFFARLQELIAELAAEGWGA